VRDRDLWFRIKYQPLYRPGEPPDTFAYQLRAAEGWTIPFCEHAEYEYSRFLYLAAISDADVAPSPVVDRVWHLHLADRDDYEDFCRGAIGAVIEHNVAGPEDIQAMEAAYIRTQELYRQEFRRTPPRLIWRTEFTQRMGRLADGMFLGSAVLFVANMIANRTGYASEYLLGSAVLLLIVGSYLGAFYGSTFLRTLFGGIRRQEIPGCIVTNPMRDVWRLSEGNPRPRGRDGQG